MKKKIIAAALICSIMFSVFAVPSSAVLTETVVAGGLIAAYMAAVGITVAVDNRSDSELGQWIYDRFQNWVDNTGTAITVGNLIAGIAIQNGQIKIQNGISRILSSFMPELVSVNIASGLTQINGIDIPLEVIHYNTTNYVYKPNYNIGESISITLNDGTTQTFSYSLGTNNVLKSPSSGVNGNYYFKLPHSIPSSSRPQDNKVHLFIVLQQNGNYALAATNLAKGYYQSGGQPAQVNANISYAGKLSFRNTSISTGEITVPLPSESLSDDEETLIDIGVPVTSVSDAAEKALATTIDGTISATYTNSNPIPPVPETNLSWVRSLHSIWEYVEYLIDQASAGFSFFSGLLAAMPVEVEFCFYGALVLLLFGGVISRLLL